MIREIYEKLKLEHRANRINRKIREIDEVLYYSDEALFEYGPISQSFSLTLNNKISELEEERGLLTEQKDNLGNKLIKLENKLIA